MAKKTIKKDDIAEKGLFDNVTNGARESKAQIELLTQAMKMLVEEAKRVKSSIPTSAPTNTKGQADFDAQARKANQTAQAKLNIDKKLKIEKAKLQQLTALENKQIKTTIQATQRLTKEQQKGLGTLQKLEIHNTKLRATRAKLNLETQRGQRILKQINAQLDINNNKIKESSDATKKQKLNIGNYTSAVGKLKGALGQLGLAFGVFQLIRGSFSVIKNFEQSQADLASVLGVNTNEMKALTDQAKLLGATTTFTASQVAELQKELAKLGFSQEEIEGMTESTLLLAEATGTDLARASEVTGATMRGFGLTAKDTQMVVDVMAKSFSSSSLDMEKFATAMSSVAPVAKNAGYSIQETTALVGTLTDRGIDASTAGSGLRNMFLLAGKAGLTLDEALVEINNSSDKTGKSFELFGTRGATLGVILAENTKDTASLTDKLNVADGSAKKMAETQRDTLGGAIALLTSAWEGLILKMNEAGGVGDILKNGIIFLADNLETIVSVITMAVKAWVAYKAIVTITVLQNRLMAQSFMQLGRSQGAVKGAMAGMTKGIQNVGKALKANAIGFIITGIVLAINKMNDVFNELNKTNQKFIDIQGEVSDIHQQAREDIASESAEIQVLTVQIKRHNAGSKERGELLQKMNEKYGTHLKNISDETEANRQLDIQVRKVIASMETRIRLQAKESEFTLIIQELQLAEEGLYKEQEKGRKLWENKTDNEIKLAFKKRAGMAGLTEEQKKFNTEQKRQFLIEASSGLKSRQQQILVNKLTKQKLELENQLVTALNKKDEATAKNVVTGDVDEEEDDGSGAGKKGKPEKIKDLNREIRDEQIKQIQDAEQREIEATKESTKRAIEDVEKSNAIGSQKATLKLELEESLQLDLMAIERKYQDIYNKEQEDYRKKIIENAEKKKAELLEIERKLKEEERENLQSELDMINKMYSDAYKEKELELLQSNKTQQEIDKELNDFEIEQLQKKIDLYKKMREENPALYGQMGDEILSMEIQLAQKKRVIWDEEEKDFKDAQAEKIKLAQQATDLMTDMFVKSIDKRIDKLDEEIEAHKDRANELEELAKNGSITAKESLAEENRLTAEAEQEKAEQEKRKQQILLVSAFIKAYLSGLDNGKEPSEALTEALTSSALLDQVASNIGSFFDGTENTGTVSNPLDANGGRLALLHNNERVMTAKQNSMIGNVSNEEVARVMENKRLGKLIDGNQTAVGWENIMLLQELNNVGSKLDMVNKTIENKPETNIRLGEITSKTMEIIESRKKGGLKTVNTFKVKAQ